MDTLNEKVAYLSGLMDGLKITDKSDEGKVLKSIVDVLKDVAEEITYLSEDQEDLKELVDEIDEDLGSLEEEFYDEDCCCCDDDDDDLYEFECPNCGETICLEDEDFEEDASLSCPACGTPIELEFECDCGDCEEEEE